MNINDLPKFIVLWRRANSLYGKVAISDDAFKMIFNALSGYELGEISEALNEIVRTSTFAPQPANVVTIIEGQRQNARRIEGNEIFSRLLNAGIEDADVVFSDKRIARAIKLTFGDLDQLAAAADNQAAFYRGRFVEAYATIKNTELQQEDGIVKGRSHNQKRPLVMFWGNYEQCLQIAKGAYREQRPCLPMPQPPAIALVSPVKRELAPVDEVVKVIGRFKAAMGGAQ